MILRRVAPLLLADTHGKPSLTWRAKHATSGAAHNATNAVRRLT